MNTALLTFALLAPAAPPAPPVPDVKANVRTGLKWLADQQKADGTWDSANGFPPTTITSYAGLALLMEGSTLKRGAYAPHLRKAVAWLEKNTGEDGKLASNDPNEMFQYVTAHSKALLFLACAYDTDDDADRRKLHEQHLTKAVAFAVSCQTSKGGWGYTRPVPGTDYDDCVSTAAVLQALFAARKAGIAVDRAVTNKGVQYLARCSNRDGGVIYSLYGGAKPMGNDGQPTVSAAAAAVLVMADDYRPPELPMWVKFGNRDAAQQLPLLRSNGGLLTYQFDMARAAFAVGETGHRRLQSDADIGEPIRWSAHRAVLFKALKEVQGKDGSWPDTAFGPQYATSLALIILQLDNDYLPAFSR